MPRCQSFNLLEILSSLIFSHSTPHHFIHHTLEQEFGNMQCILSSIDALLGERRAIGLIVEEVYIDSSSLVYSLGCGPFSGSPAAPSGSSSPVVHIWDADASTDRPWRVKERNLRGCLLGVSLVFSLASGIKLIALIGLLRSVCCSSIYYSLVLSNLSLEQGWWHIQYYSKCEGN